MISEGSCDTEDWSNDAENSALLYRNKYILKHITIEAAILNCNNISQNYFFSVFLITWISLNEHKKLC